MQIATGTNTLIYTFLLNILDEVLAKQKVIKCKKLGCGIYYKIAKDVNRSGFELIYSAKL